MDPRALRRTLIGLLVAAAIFAVMLYIVDAGAVWAALRDASLGLVVVVALLLLCWNLSWGIALWQVLETQDLGISLPRAVLYHAASAFANHVTPLGQAGGEPVTAWIITRSSDTDYEVSLASVASFDALHLIPSLSFAAVGGLYLLANGGDTDSNILWLSTAIIAVAVALPAAGYLLWTKRRSVADRLARSINGLVRWVIGVLPGRTAPDFDVVESRLSGFAQAIERVGTDRRRLAIAFGFSGLGWVFQALALWVALLALSAHVPLYVPLFAVPLGATGGGLPTPGGLGGKEAVYVTTLALLTSVDAATITAAVAIHSTGGYLFTTGLGALAVSLLGTEELY